MNDENLKRLISDYTKIPMVISIIPFIFIGIILMAIWFVVFMILATILFPIFIVMYFMELRRINKLEKRIIVEKSLRGFETYGKSKNN